MTRCSPMHAKSVRNGYTERHPALEGESLRNLRHTGAKPAPHLDTGRVFESIP